MIEFVESLETAGLAPASAGRRLAMEAVSYGTFSQSLHERVGSSRVPFSGTIEVTRRCPLECAHCYNNLPMGDREAQLAELTLDEHCRLLDEMAEAGCLWLLFTGGEIFARRDFLDIYTYAKKKGFLITLFTNGDADHRAHRRLPGAEWRPFAIEITLYGATQGDLRAADRHSGLVRRCMRGIALLLERGLPLASSRPSR